nr:sigma 54-interacting transcriptional regulator [Neobacillus ginsengisoli]
MLEFGTNNPEDHESQVHPILLYSPYTPQLPVNVRKITATHRNLEEMVQNGTFREDLYYRINVIPLHTKLLKEKRDDIPFFLQYFICKYCSNLSRSYLTMDPQLEQWLIQYDWPGNIRQLEGFVSSHSFNLIFL